MFILQYTHEKNLLDLLFFILCFYEINQDLWSSQQKFS